MMNKLLELKGDGCLQIIYDIGCVLTRHLQVRLCLLCLHVLLPLRLFYIMLKTMNDKCNQWHEYRKVCLTTFLYYLLTEYSWKGFKCFICATWCMLICNCRCGVMMTAVTELLSVCQSFTPTVMDLAVSWTTAWGTWMDLVWLTVKQQNAYGPSLDL